MGGVFRQRAGRAHRAARWQCDLLRLCGLADETLAHIDLRAAAEPDVSQQVDAILRHAHLG